MISVNNPQKVLIIGGGDGGALREVVKYSVKEIFLVDIDKKVVEVCQKFLPSVSQGAFQDKRVKVFYQDAFKFIKNYHHYFDVIIDDLTDPSGPSLFLWQSKFYRNIAQALAPKGIASFQTGYLKEKFALKARKEIKKIFPYFKSYKAFVRCFPFDEHTFSLASKDLNFSLISFNLIEEKFKKIKIKTKYYSPKIQFCSEI